MFALVLLAAAVTQVAMRNTNLRGDEYTYAAGATALGDVWRGRMSWGEALDIVLGTGWFMPGATMLAAPLHALIDMPGFAALRTWMALVNLTLLGLTARAMAKTLGKTAGIALLICPGLVAAAHIAMIAVLADYAAGMSMTLALLAAYRIALDLAAGKRPGWRDVAVFECALLASIYLRGPLALTALALHALLVLVALCAARQRVVSIARLAVGLVALAVSVAPWSIAATHRFGQPIVTTTNFPLVFADSFGNPAKTCFGPCGKGPDIWPAWRFAQERAALTGKNPLDIQRDMLASSIEGLTLRDYLHQTRAHFGTFLLDRTGTLEDMLPQAFGLPAPLRTPLLKAVAALSAAVFMPFLCALFVVNLGLFRSNTPARLQSVLLKAATACMFLQPFVHKANARYWTTFAPLAAWSAVLLWQSWPRSRNAVAPGANTLLDRTLDIVQASYIAVFAAVGLTLLAI